MHMADALLSPQVAGTMYACSTVAAAYSINKVRKISEPEKIPVMGVMGAFVFATQMINFTIPGTGSSGHLCGGMLLTALLGPEAGFVSMIAVLLVQCLLFADGGIMALGANIWNMAFYGCFVGGYFIWRQFMKKDISRNKIIVASILGSVLTLQLGALSVTIETLASGVTELPFTVFLAAMQPIHLAIGFGEGLITSAVLVFIYETKPELLWCGNKEGKEGFSLKKLIAILAGIAAIIGGVVSLFASAFPDGLEWSMEKVAGTTELARDGGMYSFAEKIQGITALLPDYSIEGANEMIGTSFSGILGGIIVVIVCVGVCYALKMFRKTTNE